MNKSTKDTREPISYAGCSVPTCVGTVCATDSSIKSEKDIQIVNDTELSFSGTWLYNRLMPRKMGLFNNTSSASISTGAYAEYHFMNCNSIKVYGSIDPTGVTGYVTLDGQHTVEITKCLASCKSGNLLFDSGSLPEGPHDIKIGILKAENQKMEIDHLEATGSLPETRMVSPLNTAYFHKTAGFHAEKSHLNNGQKLLASSESGEELTLYFYGSFVRLFGERSSECGHMTIEIDHQDPADVNCHADSFLSNALLFEKNNLDEHKYHELRLVTQNRRIAILSAEVQYANCLMTDMNIRTDQELEDMKSFRKEPCGPDEWKPVALKGSVPDSHVDLHGGAFRKAFDRNIQYLKDCYKKPYWVDKKDDCRIWVDMLPGSNEGRLLGGIGNTLCYNEDAELRAAAKKILEDIERRQFINGDGYLMPYDSNHFRLWDAGWPDIMKDEEKNYDRVMLTKGMLAAGKGGLKEAYPMVRKFYDWFNHATEYLPDMLLGCMGIQGSAGGPLVYHSPVGVPEDIITNMKFYDMDWWLEYLAQELPESVWRFTLNRPHNYLLTSICALFDIYTATGQKKYLDACLGGWNIYHHEFHLPGGGISICEHFECVPKSHMLTNLPNNIYETCGAVFWIDLNQRFLQLWPEKEMYAAQIEQSLYNFVLACQGKDGRIRYFNHMNANKDMPGRYNTCCEIQATALFGKLPGYVYMLEEDGVTVNLFSGSDISFTVKDKPFSVSMETDFPSSNSVSLHVFAPQGGSMKLRIRIPSWLASPTDISVNGHVETTGIPGTYVELERAWKDGDRIDFALPMTLKLQRYIGRDRVDGCDRYAILYGPLLMAVRGPLTSTCLQAENEPTIRLPFSASHLLDNIHEGENPLEFTIGTDSAYSLIPYYAIGDESFTCFPALDKEKS